jgi:hypothetical protein
MDGFKMTVFVDAAGLDDFQKYVGLAPKVATQAARLAINQTAERKGLKLAREAMLQQVAWPARYLNESERFRIAYRATDARLEAGIRARQSPTSLARFTGRTSAPRRGTPISVRVNPGRTVELPRAFLLNLRGGNLGLGIRLRPGEMLSNTIGAKLITSGPLAGVALLYGPSVDQVFRTVAIEIAPDVATETQNEFLRQFIRLLNG